MHAWYVEAEKLGEMEMLGHEHGNECGGYGDKKERW